LYSRKLSRIGSALVALAFAGFEQPKPVISSASFRRIDHDYGTGAGTESRAGDDVGKEECSILVSRTLPHGVWWHTTRPGIQKWSAAAQYSEVARQYDDFVGADEPGKQVVVLRALIEDFGGEATGVSLCRRIVGQAPAPARNEAQTGADIRAALAQLGLRGAITLEEMDGTEVIARITRAGALLAYEQPSLS
jgi:hypothetical protein